MSHSPYTAASIADIVHGRIRGPGDPDQVIHHLLIDSRRLTHPAATLFVALVTHRNDGHRYIPELTERGVGCFLIQSSEFKIQNISGSRIPLLRHSVPRNDVNPASRIPDPVFIVVPDTLAALQKLAAYHRQQFRYPVIGITGSNGKTVVKEWLYQLLSPDLSIVRSPKSFNSQIGVPLSVWNMESRHNLAVFEAGISLPGEMDRLEAVIRPTIGIFTTVGSAHAGFFSGDSEKVDEKLKLFRQAGVLIYRSDYTLITERLGAADDYGHLQRFTWGTRDSDDLRITGINRKTASTTIRAIHENSEAEITIPFTDEASVENAIHCWAVVQLGSRNYELGITKKSSFPIPYSSFLIPHSVSDRFQLLAPVAMRLELKEAINHCSLINDSYSADVNSLGIALDFLVQQKQHPKRTVILSDLFQTGKEPGELYREVADAVAARGVDRVIGIGEEISRFQQLFGGQKAFYPATEEFLRQCPLSSFRDEAILLKGARVFGFERIGQALQQKAHETVLEINLDALIHNLNFFRAKLNPGVRTMAMVKAFSYGSGSFEIASLLQFHRVDSIAVAYADEGVELRKAGITMPVMVMSPEEQSMELLLAWDLEPEIFSLRILRLLAEAIRKNGHDPSRKVGIHLKLDTGMHRLGFCRSDLDELVQILVRAPEFRIASVFSHLAASEDPAQDAFTREQFVRFREMSALITQAVDYPVVLHILNSAGISRFPEMQLDMVRLGIGLYGIGHDQAEQEHLRNVSSLKTIVTQIKHIEKGETVGYNRRGVAERETVLAVVPVGYADGLSRRLGNGRGAMLVNGRPAPLIGNVCMDLCMLDITDVVQKGGKVSEGDDVIVFGDALPVTRLAKTLRTIPYEVMTGISRRVKRIYFHE